jgi:hypothetical protein
MNREDKRKEACTVSQCGNTYFDRLDLSSQSNIDYMYLLTPQVPMGPNLLGKESSLMKIFDLALQSKPV